MYIIASYSYILAIIKLDRKTINDVPCNTVHRKYVEGENNGELMAIRQNVAIQNVMSLMTKSLLTTNVTLRLLTINMHGWNTVVGSVIPNMAFDLVILPPHCY